MNPRRSLAATVTCAGALLLLALTYQSLVALKGGGERGRVKPPTKAPQVTARTSPDAAPKPPSSESPRAVQTIAAEFSRAYWEKWVGIWNRLKTGGAWELRALVKDPDFARLCLEVKGRLTSSQLLELFNAAQSDVRYLALALLAQGGDPNLLGLFAAGVSDTERENPIVQALCSWGLASIASEASLAILTDRVRKRYLSGSTNESEEYALGLAGKKGVSALVQLTEEFAGNIKLERRWAKSQLLGWCDSPDTIDDLKQLASSHPFPQLRALAARAILLQGDVGELAVVIANEKDDACRRQMMWELGTFAFLGSLKPQPPEIQRAIGDLISANSDLPKSTQLRALMFIDPDRYADALHDALTGKSLTQDDRRNLISDLPNFKTPHARALLEKIALSTSLDDPPEILSALSRAGPISNPALIDRLSQFLSGAGQRTSGAELEHAVRALAQVPGQVKDQMLSQLPIGYEATWIPQKRIAILEALPAFGDRGQQLLKEKAQEPGDVVVRIAALTALSKLPSFQSDPDLRRTAMDFIRSVRPSSVAGEGELEDIGPVSFSLNLRYLEFFSNACVSSATRNEDLALLRELAENPQLPVRTRNPGFADELRKAALAAIDAIRLSGHDSNR